MENNVLDPNFLEKLIIKGATIDKTFLILIANVFKPEYFNSSSISMVFKILKDHMTEHKNIAPRDVIINSIDNNTEIIELFTDIDSIDFDIAGNYSYLTEETNKYLKEQAVKGAIMESVDIIDSGGDKNIIRQKIEEALCKDIKIDLGLNYFGQLGERLRRIFTASDVRIPTYFPQFDEYINGGFPPFTLSVMTAKIHGWKSNIMANFISRQVLHGHNVVLMSLEMAQDAFAQRFDSIYSLMDINRMYISDDYRTRLVERLRAVKDTENRGNLYIKQFPTGKASIKDFRIYLRELLLRGIKPHIVYVDYINLMASEFSKSDNMYSRIKAIAEELRAMSFEFEVPIISVSQLNREGSFVGFEELDFNYIAECLDPETMVIKDNGFSVKLDSLKVGDMIKGSDGYVKVKRIWPKKKKTKYKIITKSGKEIICSSDHKFPTDKGIKSINTGMEVGNKLESQ